MKILVDDKDIRLDDLSDLLGSSTGPADKSLIKIKGQGPHKGDGRGKEIDELTKEFIAIDSASASLTKDVTQSEIANIYGVTQTTVSHLGQGKLGTGDDANVDESLKNKVARVRDNIEESATSKLLATLDLFNPNGLEDQNQIINAAQKMASVVEKIRGNKDSRTGPQVQVILYQPRMKEVKDFDVIEVG